MTEKPAFTPGPLLARRINDLLRPYAVINPNGPHGDEMVAGYLSEADATFYAAAPDIFDELDIRVGDLVMLRRAIEEGDPKAELLIRIDDMLRETSAALSKALGKDAP